MFPNLLSIITERNALPNNYLEIIALDTTNAPLGGPSSKINILLASCYSGRAAKFAVSAYAARDAVCHSESKLSGRLSNHSSFDGKI